MFAVMATVSEVDDMTLTCTLSPLDGRADIFDVPMQGVAIGQGWVLVPKVGSKVLAVFTSPKSASIVTTPEVEMALLHAGLVELGGEDGEPVVLGESLNETLDALFGQLDQFFTDLKIFGTNQAALCTGPLAPLASGFTNLFANTSNVQLRVDQIRSVLDDHLSEKVTTI
jgi:hypothetical protein